MDHFQAVKSRIHQTRNQVKDTADGRMGKDSDAAVFLDRPYCVGGISAEVSCVADTARAEKLLAKGSVEGLSTTRVNKR
jgi:hypothetical protein